MAQADNSTRTIAGIAAVVAILALVLTIVDSARTGLIAQYAGTTKEMSEENDKAILTHVNQVNQRVDALQQELADMKKTAMTPPAPAGDAEGENGGGE